MADIVAVTGADVSATAMPVPAKNGYTFDGWFDGEGEGAARVTALPASMPAGTTTYYARWTANAAYVVFDSQWTAEHDVTLTGTTGAPLRGEEQIPSFADGVRGEGWTFEGWFDAEGNQLVELPATYPAGTTTYVARWTQAGFGQIVFYANGGTAVAAMTGEAGAPTNVTAWPTTTRDGYALDGWYSDAACTQKASDGAFPATFVEGTTAFYAKWNANEAKIVFQSNGGSQVDAIEGHTGDSIANRLMPTTAKDGYTFAGWYDNAECAGVPVTSLPETMPAGIAEGEGQPGVTTYYAKWTPGTVTITFDTQGGTSVTPMSGTVGEALASTALPESTREGYTLSGWYTGTGDDAIKLDALPGTFPTADVTYYAKWSANGASITFDPADGTFAEGEDVNADGKVVWSGHTDEATGKTSLPSVTREGYVFAGWMAADGTVLSGAPATYPAGDATYVAQWTVMGQGSVKFVLGNGSDALTRTGAAGQPVGDFPDEPTREGYAFAGWFDNVDCTGDAVESLDDVTFVENATLTYYAKWTPNKVVLSFDVDGGTPSSVTIEGYVGERLESTQFPTVSKPGYALGGWFTTETFDEGTQVESLPETFPVASETYYVKWVAQAASIVFEPNGGTLDPVTYTGVTGGETRLGAWPVPVRAGYTFAGWYASSDLSGDALADSDLPAAFAPGTTTYYAKWAAGEVTITFDAKGGTASVEQMTGTIGEPIGNTNMPSATRDGYVFAGWFDDAEYTGNAVASLPSTWPVADKTYYAKWTPAAASIVFDVNPTNNPKLDGVLQQPAALEGRTGDAIDESKRAMPVLTLPDDFEFAGEFEFIEWQDAQGSAVEQLPATFPAGTTTYYAIWQYSGDVTITFNAQGGTLADDPRLHKNDDGSYSNYMVGKPGTIIRVTTMPEVTREGYRFAGWYENADYSGSEVTRLDGAFSSNKSYYAKWEAQEAKIVFDTGQGGSAIDDLVGTTGAKIENRVIPTPTRDGYDLAGWTARTSDDKEVRLTQKDGQWLLPSVFPAGTTTVTAQWTAKDAQIVWAAGYEGGTDLVWVGKTGMSLADADDLVDGADYTQIPAKPARGEEWTWLGWYDASGSEVTELPAAFAPGKTTFTGKWARDGQGTIVFDAKGGTPVDSLSGDYDTKVSPRTMPVTTREGYTFAGWYDGEGDDAAQVNVLPATFAVEKLTYYARWTPLASTITFVTGKGGAVQPMNGVTGQLFSADGSEAPMPIAERAGYTLEGWYATPNFTGDKATTLGTAYPAGGATYYAKWTANEARIVFIGPDGSIVTEVVGLTDEEIADRTMPVPTREGYTFLGWFLSDGTEVAPEPASARARAAAAAEGAGNEAVTELPETFPAGGLNYYSKWEALPAYIMFESNYDGVESKTYTGVTDGNTADATPSAVAVPEVASDVREGWTFEGWFDGSGIEVTDDTLPATFAPGTTTYTARWVQNGAGLIEFYSMGGSDVESMMGTGGTSTGLEAWPETTREGYTFAGWFDNAGCEGEALADDAFPKTFEEGVRSFWAKWTADEARIVFDAQGGTLADDDRLHKNDDGTQADYIGGHTDDAITDTTMPAVSKAGCKLVGWFAATDGIGTRVTMLPASMPAGTTTYHAVWAASNVTITFDSCGGSLVGSLEGAAGSPIADTTLPETSKLGYTFGGWFENANFSGSAISELPATFPDADKTYYAGWAPNDVRIVLGAGEGTFPEGTFGVSDDGKQVTWSGKTDAATPQTTLPVPKRDGYVFEGWFDADGMPVSGAPATFPAIEPDEGTPTAGTVAYTARWSAEGEGIIRFVANGGSAVADITGRIGESPAQTSMPESTRNGYGLVGWYDNATLDGVPVTSLAGVKFADAPYVLYAKWDASASKIEFVTNGGSAVDAMEGVTDQRIADVTLPETEQAGYELVGWFSDSEFAEGTQIWALPSTFPAGGATFYAKWQAAEARIVFHTNGADTTIWPMVGTTGQQIENTAMPGGLTRFGYTFGGWYDNAECTGDAVTELPGMFPAGTTDYYAKWTPISVKATFHANGGTFAEGTEGASADGKKAVWNGRFDDALGGTMPSVTREGYLLAGWYGNAECTGEPVTSLPATWPATDLEFWAKWAPKPASVAFDANGGTFAEDTEGLDGGRVVWTGETGTALGHDAWPTASTMVPPKNDEGEDMVFVEWTDAATGGNALGAAPAPGAVFASGDHVYYAQWTDPSAVVPNPDDPDNPITGESVVVSFDARGGMPAANAVTGARRLRPARLVPQRRRGAGGRSQPDAGRHRAAEGRVRKRGRGNERTLPAGGHDALRRMVRGRLPGCVRHERQRGVRSRGHRGLGSASGRRVRSQVQGRAGRPGRDRGAQARGLCIRRLVRHRNGRRGRKRGGAVVHGHRDRQCDQLDRRHRRGRLEVRTDGGQRRRRRDGRQAARAEGQVERDHPRVGARADRVRDRPRHQDGRGEGALRSRTPEAIRVSQVSVEQDAEGFAGLFGQVDADVKLNMSASADADRIILAVPEEETIKLPTSQLMSFTIPAWAGGEEPASLNVTYSLELGELVQLGQVLNSTKLAEVFYVFELA